MKLHSKFDSRVSAYELGSGGSERTAEEDTPIQCEIELFSTFAEREIMSIIGYMEHSGWRYSSYLLRFRDVALASASIL